MIAPAVDKQSVGAELAAFPALDSTTPGASVNAEGAPAASLAALRELIGLTWDQFARLFSVSRRAVHFWAERRRLAPSHEEHLRACFRWCSSSTAARPVPIAPCCSRPAPRALAAPHEATALRGRRVRDNGCLSPALKRL